MQRTNALVSLRPKIETQSANNSKMESFQNSTLRPILKFQHNLLVAIFGHYLSNRKTNFFTLEASKKVEFVKQLLQKDIVFRNQLIGVVLGLFTVNELDFYLKHEKEGKKRIISMLCFRLVEIEGGF